jgi:GAF domain-containing protein
MTTPETTDSRLGPLRKAILEARDGLAGSSKTPGRSAVSTSGEIDQTTVAFNVFEKLLATEGIRAALYAVLRQSQYRFISIFRFKDGKATSAVHVDRTDLSVTQAGEVADTATYCCYVRDADHPFATADASLDPRTRDHVAREVVRSYCGIPIFEPDGALIGTLCHYDLEPRDPEHLNLSLLLQVSSAIAQSGLVPPYPASTA